jgi:hypothetical protein
MGSGWMIAVAVQSIAACDSGYGMRNIERRSQYDGLHSVWPDSILDKELL